MRPPMFRKSEDNRAVTVGADDVPAKSCSEGDFWKGMFVGVGSVFIFGATLALGSQAIEASRTPKERRLNRDQLLAGREHA